MSLFNIMKVQHVKQVSGEQQLKKHEFGQGKPERRLNLYSHLDMLTTN